ncbi:YdhK family protein [Rothia sp. LK2588]|uniref:YdhK family protein n=1 Tax=Rothia sp. LK2588 TaxID=3114369 RepID=UPI0034CE83BF
MFRTPALFATAAVAALTLAGCGANGSGDATSQSSSSSQSAAASASESMAGHGHGHHQHSMDGGAAPAGIAEATNPKYPVGTKVTLNADHMEGMKGAPGKIVGAYKTTTYAVDYTPTDGGEPVKDHKWVVQEELKDAGKNPLKVGDKAVIEAEHMPGMKGGEATIAEVTDQTVYMVDYEADGMTMTNHKWVTEDEVAPAK